MSNISENLSRVVGITLTAAGTLSHTLGMEVQANLLAVPENLRRLTYQSLIDKWGKITIDYLITSGEDLGVVLGVYGMDLLNIPNQKLNTYILKIAVLFAGTLNELVEHHLFEDATFSPLDLAIFSIPLIWELSQFKKNVTNITSNM